MTEHRTIAQRELRNDVGRVLREAEAGTVFTITVRGRAVASLGPPVTSSPQVDVEWSALLAILADPLDGTALARDLDAAEAPIDDPWPA